MSNDWNESKIWNTQTPPYPPYAGDNAAPPSSQNSYYNSNPNPYYNAAPQQPFFNQNPQYFSAPPGGSHIGYQNTTQPPQMGYPASTAPPSQPSSDFSQQDASLVLQAVTTLNQTLGGLDIDQNLLNALTKQISRDNATDVNIVRRPEIYSPTLNSPSPSPERKKSKDEFEVDGKKMISSKPFYEQYNPYGNDDTNVSRDSEYRRRSRSVERRGRTWAGSVSPPHQRQQAYRKRSPYGYNAKSPVDPKVGRRRSRSPYLARSNRYEESAGPSRRVRSRSPLKRKRSRSNDRDALKSKVKALLGLSKFENRLFVEAQTPSSVLLVMNLDSWITHKVLWGAIHKYAREYGTMAPFYIETATFQIFDTNLALIAFTTQAAAEICMKHLKCELEVTGRSKKNFKMMYYSENTLLFDALGYKFTGIWKAVLKKRADQALEDKSSRAEKKEKSADTDLEGKSPRAEKKEKSADSVSTSEKESANPAKSEDTHADKKEVSGTQKREPQKVNVNDPSKLEVTSKTVMENTEIKTENPSPEPKKKPKKEKAQVNIIKTNVLIGKMKSYLIKQNKAKPEVDANPDGDLSNLQAANHENKKLDGEESKNKMNDKIKDVSKGSTNESIKKAEKVSSERPEKSNQDTIDKTKPNVKKIENKLDEKEKNKIFESNNNKSGQNVETTKTHNSDKVDVSKKPVVSVKKSNAGIKTEKVGTSKSDASRATSEITIDSKSGNTETTTKEIKDGAVKTEDATEKYIKENDKLQPAEEKLSSNKVVLKKETKLVQDKINEKLNKEKEKEMPKKNKCLTKSDEVSVSDKDCHSNSEENKLKNDEIRKVVCVKDEDSVKEQNECTSLNLKDTVKQQKAPEKDSSKNNTESSDSKTASKRKLSPNQDDFTSARRKKEAQVDDDPVEDSRVEDSVSERRKQEAEIAELYGRNVEKKYTSRRRRSRSREFDRKRGRSFDKRDERSRPRDDDYRRQDFAGDNRRDCREGNNWREDRRRRHDNKSSFDDIDGNEDDYWTQKNRSSKQAPPASINPWIENKPAPAEVKTLSLKELRDPEFLLRVLLQTSIMIQNNQLTMSNPLDSLTPTDKDLILQTLTEIEGTSEATILMTLNDSSKFNAAEHRVLVEALSNILMFKAALLPPEQVSSNKGVKQMEIDDDSCSYVQEQNEKSKEMADVYVSMRNIKHWINESHLIKYLKDFNLKYDHVKVHPAVNSNYTSGYIKFNDVESASELLKKTNKVIYIGKETVAIRLVIEDVTPKPARWTCTSCGMKNIYETLICFKCQKLREKLRDVNTTKETTNKCVLINFKNTTTVDDLKSVLTKICPYLSGKFVLHIDSCNDQVHNFLCEFPTPQSCISLRRSVLDNEREFSHIRVGPRIAFNFLELYTPVNDGSTPATPGQRMYTFVDVPRLAAYSASLYASNDEQRAKFYDHYTHLYTQELMQGRTINVVLPEDANPATAGSNVPTGTDNKQWPPPKVNTFTYDATSGYFYDHSTGLYYESSSQYFYNMEIGKFLQYNPTRSTYVLVQTSEISSAPVKAAPRQPSNAADTASEPRDEEENDDLPGVPTTKESKIDAKKVIKNMEKWAKTVKKQDKRKAPPNVMNALGGNTERATPADVCFDMVLKTPDSVKSGMSAIPSISSLILEHNSLCEDEEEENGFIDWQNFTCNLCHRVFNNAEILNKHSKLSELHKTNLKQWYVSKNLDPESEENRQRQYRDRASERRQKATGKQPQRSQDPAESWLCSTPMCMAYKRSGFDTCLTCASGTPATTQHSAEPNMSVGSQLLKKMGWEQGTALGKNKKQTNANMRSDYLGLGADREETRIEGESYKNFIKRSTQKRYQQSGRY